MRTSIFLAIFFLLCHCILSQDITWESLTGNLYRPGYWWTIRIKIPSEYSMSSCKLVSTLGQWSVITETSDARAGYAYASFPVFSQSSSFSLKLSMPEGKENSLDSRQWNLQRLKPEERLIGIVGGVEKYLVERALYSQERPPYTVFLKAIPDLWEAIECFDMIVLRSEDDISESDALVLSQWVSAGGQLVVLDGVPVKHRALQNVASNAERLPSNDKSNESSQLPIDCKILYAEEGRGGLLYFQFSSAISPEFLEKQIFSDKMLKAWNIISEFFRIRGYPKEETNIEPAIEEVFSPGVWRAEIRWLACSLCVVHLLALLLMHWHVFSWKARLASLAILTCLSILSLAFMIWIFVPIQYESLVLTSLRSHSSQAMQTEYHRFYSLRDQILEHTFQTLPMPIFVSETEAPASPIVLSRYSDAEAEPGGKVFTQRWHLKQGGFLRHSSCLWRTKRLHSLVGRMELKAFAPDNRPLRVTNLTSLELSDTLYLDSPGFIPCRDIKTGEEMSFCEQCPSFSFVLRTKAPDSWQKEWNLLQWLEGKRKCPVIAGFEKNLERSRLWMNYHQKHIVWFEIRG